MVVETSLGAAFGVTAIPHANVYGVDRRFALSKQMAGEKFPYRLGIDSSPPERGIKVAPSATMGYLEAQVGGRRNGAVGGEDGVGEFEESVCPAVEAFVERAAEAVQSIGRFHDAPIMHPPPVSRTPYLLWS
jgi:hypothetical protein